MALTIPSLIALSAATTAATGAEAKVLALVSGLVAAVVAEAGYRTPLNGAAQGHIAELDAELIANVAEFQTALGL